MKSDGNGTISWPKVKSLRLHGSWRAAAVAVLLVSWLVATNHCTFGLMPREGAAHASCPGCKPGKPAPKAAMECCKTIHGTLAPEMARVKCDLAAGGITLAFWPARSPEFAAREPRRNGAIERGPPRSDRFAVSILQRSFLSHAPPSAV